MNPKRGFTRKPNKRPPTPDLHSGSAPSGLARAGADGPAEIKNQGYKNDRDNLTGAHEIVILQLEVQ